MIFYFSGTGNSLWVASSIAEAFSERLVAMSDYFASEPLDIPLFSLAEKERVGFVSPVHSWGIPQLVKDFIRKVRFENNKTPFIYGIFTCGDDCGYTKQMFHKLLTERGWSSRHVYSVKMPNNYIVFPGFDIDGEELERQKKEDAKQLLPRLIRAIAEDKPEERCYITGKMPFLKSRVIYPLFCKYGLNSKPFYATGKCIACGVCVRRCPTKNIHLIDDRPVWGNDCTQCLACLHYCPVRAIEYGKMTQKKGRYIYGSY